MSDFDKEAERERLREKYEKDTEKREATERMSDLLLQGATMTDTHCDTCGDPLFRYDGEEFCPTCQRTDGDAVTANDSTTRTDAADTRTPQNEDRSTSTVETPQSPADVDSPEPRDAQRETDAGSQPATRRAPPAQQREDATRNQSAQPFTETGANATDLDGAEASVSRTLARLATQAENDTDLARTREQLAGVREAAEALAAVRNARR